MDSEPQTPSATGARVAFRAIAAQDVRPVAAATAAAFERYRSFAPSGWVAPSLDTQAETLMRWLEDPGFWGEVAREYGRLVGHATFIPAARHSFAANPDPALAHLGHMFVSPDHWGSGLGGALMADAMRAARERGFASMRLFVPDGQARARAFYAREGFSAAGEPFAFEGGLPVLEYRRERL